VLDPGSKLREATGLFRTRFLIDDKLRRFQDFFFQSYFYHHLLNASDSILQGAWMSVRFP
jgi:hypothetical protein